MSQIHGGFPRIFEVRTNGSESVSVFFQPGEQFTIVGEGERHHSFPLEVFVGLHIKQHCEQD